MAVVIGAVALCLCSCSSRQRGLEDTRVEVVKTVLLDVVKEMASEEVAQKTFGAWFVVVDDDIGYKLRGLLTSQSGVRFEIGSENVRVKDGEVSDIITGKAAVIIKVIIKGNSENKFRIVATTRYGSLGGRAIWFDVVWREGRAIIVKRDLVGTS